MNREYIYDQCVVPHFTTLGLLPNDNSDLANLLPGLGIIVYVTLILHVGRPIKLCADVKITPAHLQPVCRDGSWIVFWYSEYF